MTAEEFAGLFGKEKSSLLDRYFGAKSETAVGKVIASLSLSPEQIVGLRQVIDGVLTDSFYTVLLALDGCASLGGKQIDYELKDEDGNILTGAGEIEAAAWQEFHA